LLEIATGICLGFMYIYNRQWFLLIVYIIQILSVFLIPTISWIKHIEIGRIVDAHKLAETEPHMRRFRWMIRTSCAVAIFGGGYICWQAYVYVLQMDKLLIEGQLGANYFSITIHLVGICLPIWFTWVPLCSDSDKTGDDVSVNDMKSRSCRELEPTMRPSRFRDLEPSMRSSGTGELEPSMRPSRTPGLSPEQQTPTSTTTTLDVRSTPSDDPPSDTPDTTRLTITSDIELGNLNEDSVGKK